MGKSADSKDDTVVSKSGRQTLIQARRKDKPDNWFGRDRDIILIHGDIGAPIEVEWDAETGEDRR